MSREQVRVVRPTTLTEALEALRDAAPGAEVLAGGTDLMPAWHAGRPFPSLVVDLWGVHALCGVRRTDAGLSIGALTTFSEICRSDEVRRSAPVLVEAARTIGAAQIQNRGTLGGNVANASPAGDSLVVLLALDASLVLASAERGERYVPADRFWLAYRKTALARDEIVVRVELPHCTGSTFFRKVGTRRAQAISKVVMCLALETGAEGVVTRARLAYGSVAPVPTRALGAEAALEARRLSPAIIDAACRAVSDDISPIDDVRSTRAYRLHVAQAILRRALSQRVQPNDAG